MSQNSAFPVGPVESELLTHATVDQEERDLMRLRLIPSALLRENPALGLTVVYLAASVIGVVFHFMFLRRFGFNVLEFSETTDFLMVVIREPLTVALALLGLPFYLLYGACAARVGRWFRGRVHRLSATPEKRRHSIARLRPLMPWLQVAFVTVYAIVFVQFYSHWRASRIQAGDFRAVAVHYKTDSPDATGALTSPQLALLGTTSRFVFLYDPAAKQSHIVPTDSIARLVWDARTRKEREASGARPAPAPAPTSPAPQG